MKIRKTEPSVGILGKIVNLFSNSTKDTYSCDYINNNAGLRKVSNMSYIDLTEPGIYLVDSPTMTDTISWGNTVTDIPFETILYVSSYEGSYEGSEYDYVTQLLIGPEAIYTRSLSKNLNTGVVEDIYPWNFQQYKNVINVEAEGSDMAYSCDYINNKISEVVENGLNSSGEYTKFSDGTIHCYGTSSVITFAEAGVKDGSVDLTPFNLKSNKNVQLTLMVNYSDYGNGKFQVHLKSSDINKITFSVRNEYTSNINFYVSWFVIGKWK